MTDGPSKIYTRCYLVSRSLKKNKTKQSEIAAVNTFP